MEIESNLTEINQKSATKSKLFLKDAEEQLDLIRDKLRLMTVSNHDDIQSDKHLSTNMTRLLVECDSLGNFVKSNLENLAKSESQAEITLEKVENELSQIRKYSDLNSIPEYTVSHLIY